MKRFYLARIVRDRPSINSVLHIWDGCDTACKMASTGVLDLSHFTIIKRDLEVGMRVCALCKAASEGRGCHAVPTEVEQ